MEMQKLMDLLDNAKIPYEVRDCYGTPQICYPTANNSTMICDVICHAYSYGYEYGLLEIMGLVDIKIMGEDVEGYLTAEEVFSRIQKHYQGK